MTDKEIIKALECCLVDGCDICPCSGEASCVRAMADNALDLINRQQAEIDKLKSDVFGMEFETAMYKAISESARTEAIKEFVQELKDRTAFYQNAGTSSFIEGCIETKEWYDTKIDELAKEMGADNG